MAEQDDLKPEFSEGEDSKTNLRANPGPDEKTVKELMDLIEERKEILKEYLEKEQDEKK